MCNYCKPNSRPLVWEPHDMYAYVNTAHVDGPRIDLDIYEGDGRRVWAHVPIRCCPMCGRDLHVEVEP